VLRIRRHQQAGDRPGDQDQPPGSPGRPERERRDDVATADQQERQRHHPPVGRTLRGERANRIGDRIESWLQAGGDRPSADQEDRSRCR
jgi:hypothetical protein